MTFYSPLRYPGGKNRLSKFILNICIDNNIDGHYVEPFAGGASVALHLLVEKKVNEITINDFDKSIYAFWYSVLNNTTRLCKLIKQTPITIDEWKKQKDIQKNKNKHSLLKLGFSTLFLNRTNFSGIITGGPLGGIKQKGEYKLGCRFNKKEIIKRIKKISLYKNKIKLYNLDAVDLVKLLRNKLSNKTLFYLDPPYYNKGKELYLNYYLDDDHKQIAEEINRTKKQKWIITYDNEKLIKKLYKKNKKLSYSLSYSAGKSKKGKELMIFSDNLKILKPLTN